MLVVFDASTIVGAALRRDGIPRQTLLVAREQHVIALSSATLREMEDVLRRPKFAGMLTDDRRAEVLGLLTAAAIWVEPITRVADCRDAKDDKYLELAATAGADVIVASDAGLLVLHPWRQVRILRPREFLAATAGAALS